LIDLSILIIRDIIVPVINSRQIVFYNSFGSWNILILNFATKIIIIIIGLLGGIFLFKFYKIGYYLLFLWLLLNTIIITYGYGISSEQAAMGVGSLNLQGLWILQWWHYYSKTYHPNVFQNYFNEATNEPIFGIGINYIGIILFILLLLYYIKEFKIIDSSKRKLSIRCQIFVSKIILVTQHALIAGLVILSIHQLSSYLYINYFKKQKVIVTVERVEIQNQIEYATQIGNVNCLLINFFINIKNIDEKAIMIDDLSFNLIKTKRINNNFKTYYNYLFTYFGSRNGLIVNITDEEKREGFGLEQYELYINTPKSILKYIFNPIRLKSFDMSNIVVTFVIPVYLLIDKENISDYISFEGEIIASSINGEKIISQFYSPLIRHNFKNSLKIEIDYKSKFQKELETFFTE
jgi:hypothetical protein